MTRNLLAALIIGHAAAFIAGLLAGHSATPAPVETIRTVNMYRPPEPGDPEVYAWEGERLLLKPVSQLNAAQRQMYENARSNNHTISRMRAENAAMPDGRRLTEAELCDKFRQLGLMEPK